MCVNGAWNESKIEKNFATPQKEEKVVSITVHSGMNHSDILPLHLFHFAHFFLSFIFFFNWPYAQPPQTVIFFLSKIIKMKKNSHPNVLCWPYIRMCFGQQNLPPIQQRDFFSFYCIFTITNTVVNFLTGFAALRKKKSFMWRKGKKNFCASCFFVQEDFSKESAVGPHSSISPLYVKYKIYFSQMYSTYNTNSQEIRRNKSKNFFS